MGGRVRPLTGVDLFGFEGPMCGRIGLDVGVVGHGCLWWTGLVWYRDARGTPGFSN
jgi:hypothetical protein